jgi:hypothetical protein
MRNTAGDRDYRLQAALKREAREFIREVGRDKARRVSDAEIFRAVCDVTYPFGRIGLYQAVRDILENEAR